MIAISSLIIGLIVGFVVGRNWNNLNSVDDIAAAYQKAKDNAEAAKAKVEAAVKEAEEKAAAAKALL